MVTVYVGGKAVNWADAEKLFAEPSALAHEVEFRNDAGRLIARVVPEPEPATADDPDWVKAITPEKIKEAMEGPFFTFEEMKERLGWE